MNVSITQGEQVTVATVGGDMDFNTAGRLLAVLRHAVPNSALGLVLDLRAADFLDSSGIGVLFEVAQRLGRREQRLDVVVAPESPVADVLDEVAFASCAAVHTELAEAIGEVQSLSHG